MKHNSENKFYWAAKSFAGVVVFGISIVSAQVFITEITDPQNSSDAGRYLELYNSGSADVDLSTGWTLQRWTNGNTDPQSPKDLTGTIPAGGFYIICNSADKFLATYGFNADQDIGTGGPADSNGDDNIALLDNSGAIVDIFGVPGEDGTGTAHDFVDGRAERNGTVTSGNSVWDATEWNVVAGGISAPDGFDPAAWVGVSTGGNSAPVVNAGSDQEVMANATDGTAPVTLDGSATYDLQDDAMTYLWTSDDGTEVSTDVVFTTELAVGTYTFILTANDGELDGTDDVVITVTPFLNAYAVTFNLDMSEVTVDNDGVQISGLGDPNISYFAMMDDDMDGVYTATVDLFEGDHTYNFRNGWDYESGDALSACASGTYGNDRSVSVVDGDVVLDAVCWESCDACSTEEPGGCTDPYALNYDPNATVDDGSCEYDEGPGDVHASIDYSSTEPMNIGRYGAAHAGVNWETSEGFISFAVAVGGMSAEVVTDDDGGLDTVWTRTRAIDVYVQDNNAAEEIVWFLGEDSLEVGRRYPDAEVYEYNLYVIGGDIPGPHAADVVEVVDIEDGVVTTHSTVNPYPVQYGASASVPSSGIYVWGGTAYHDNEDGTGYHYETNRLYRFDPNAAQEAQWTRLADMPDSLASMDGVYAADAIWSFGGHSSVHGASKKIYKYDIATDMWTVLNEELPQTLSSLTAVYDPMVNNIMLIGDYSDIEHFGYFDLDDGLYYGGESNINGARHASSVLLGNKVLTFGGYQPAGYNGNVEPGLPSDNSQLGIVNWDYDGPDVDCNGYYGEYYNDYDCDNLHLALDLSCSDWGDRDDLLVRIRGPWWYGWDPDLGPSAYYDSDGYWVVELEGYPTEQMEYQWVVIDTNSFENDETYLEDQLLLANNAEADEWSCTPVTDWWSYANRAWNPEVDGLWPAGWSDDNWPVDTWGTCVDCYDDASDFVYLGQHGESEYYISSYELDWWEAKDDIGTGNDDPSEMGDHMLTINSDSEGDFVNNMVDMYLGPDIEFWLGATDEDMEGEWHWVTGEPFDEYTNWGPTEPNGGTDENHAHVLDGGDWADTPGTDSMRFVVEVPADTEPPYGPIYLADYTMDVSSLSSTELPFLDLSDENAGIKISASFVLDTSDPTNEGAHAAGLLSILFDANWNGQPDTNDISMFELFGNDGNDGNDGDDGDDGNIVTNGLGTAVLFVDNGPDDESDVEGVFEITLDPDFDDNSWLMIQGATYFIVPLTHEALPYVGENSEIESHALSPVYSGDNNIGGSMHMMGETGEPILTEPVPNMFVFSLSVADAFGGEDSEDDNTDDEDDPVPFIAVTDLSGDYTIGVADTGLYFTGTDELFGDGRKVALPYPYDNTESWPGLVHVGIGETAVQNFAVMLMNTMVHGQVVDNNGMPVSHADLWFEYEEEGGFRIENDAETDDDGYYDAWIHMPWAWEVEIETSYGGYQFFEDNLETINASYDEYAGHYYLSYNPVLQHDGGGPGEQATISGTVSVIDMQGNMMDEQYPVWVDIWGGNSEDFYDGTWTDMSGHFSIQVPPHEYFWIEACIDDAEMDCTESIGFYAPGAGNELTMDLNLFLEQGEATVTGIVLDESGYAVYDAEVKFEKIHMNSNMENEMDESWYTYTDYDGAYEITVPHGTYDVRASKEGLLSDTHPNQLIEGDMVLDFTLYPIVISGSVSGVIYLIGDSDYQPDHIYVNVYNDQYDIWQDVSVTESGTYYNFGLPDGSYDIYVDAGGYASYYEENAFAVTGIDVVYDVTLFVQGFVGAPHIHDLVDVPNDQGRQMRTIWDHGNPGSDEYFTQFSIWRQVPNVPIELWDYITTVPWHGAEELYAAVVPTLGDSISPEMIYWSTFMVTAHTEDVDHFVDSEPVSGYSIDNLHPGAPMNLMMTQEGDDVSLSWSAPQDDDFSYHNIYRQDLGSAEPAIVFTTVDSFFVDQDVDQAGSWEYWITAVDVNSNESDPSGVVFVVLSAYDTESIPTAYALEQNYPNPFNPSTQIRYALPEEAMVSISVYDLMGRKVRTLVSGVQSPGYRSVVWNATNDMGRHVSAGVYIYSIQTGNFIQNRKLVLMK